MPKLTDVQAHVLANLDRVENWPRKTNTISQHPRFQLDGKECTMQITSLIVRGKVRHLPSGTLQRLPSHAATLSQ